MRFTLVATVNVLALVGFYRFSAMDHARRLKWVKAVKRKNWMPTVHSRICGDHFVSGMYVSFPCGIERLSFTVSVYVQENRSTTAVM